MKKIVTGLLVLMFFLVSFSCLNAAYVNIDNLDIDSSEKNYVKIKQLLLFVQNNSDNNKKNEFAKEAISLSTKKSTKAEIYYFVSTIKEWTVLDEFKDKTKTRISPEVCDLQGAMENIDKAISLNKKQAKYYEQKAEIYRNKKDFQNAITFYDKAIELNPNNSKCFYERAVCKYLIKKNEDAINDLSSALKIEEKPEYYSYKSYYEKLIGKKNEALADIEKAIEISGEDDPNYCVYIRRRAELKYELGLDLKDILKDIDVVIDGEKLNTNNLYWAYSLKGKILESQKEYKEAVEAYKKSLEFAENKGVLGYKIKFLEEKINNK
ncbi:MAG: tetratricopeptide repeat protein [Elusimicrobia bacterium]|nr:tetratricopeptide repeat protein [Elusimicrobiota bacterium]